MSRREKQIGIINILLPIITYLLGIASLIIKNILLGGATTAATVICLVVPCIPFIFPAFYNTKYRFPLLFNILACIQVTLCIYGGTVFNVYAYSEAYDQILHTYFGFVASMYIYYLLMKYTTLKDDWKLYIIIVLLVLGLAACWEMIEYTADTLYGADNQKVQECINKGISPIADTMEDIMISVVGIIIFYATLLISNVTNEKYKNYILQKNKEAE